MHRLLVVLMQSSMQHLATISLRCNGSALSAAAAVGQQRSGICIHLIRVDSAAVLHELF
jgi:hypothetical protein